MKSEGNAIIGRSSDDPRQENRTLLASETIIVTGGKIVGIRHKKNDLQLGQAVLKVLDVKTYQKGHKPHRTLILARLRLKRMGRR
jgi:hypothetical protein